VPLSRQPIRLLAILLILAFSVSTSLGAEYSPRKRVLIIESFGQPPATAGAVAFRTTLERELGQPVDVYQLSLDVARFPGPDHEAELVSFLQSRYQHRKLDLVAPMQAPAVNFVARQRERVFANVPVVITGIERRRVPPGMHTATTTHVAGEIDLPAQIENILQLLPSTRRIVMLSGSSAYDKFWAERTRNEFQRFAGRVDIDWVEGLSLEDMRELVAGYPSGTVVLLGLLVLDAAGIQIGRDEVLERLHEVSKVPIFGFFESYLGKGVVGGKHYADVALGIEAARIAIRILKGEAAGTIEPLVVKAIQPTYDWRELQRFGIDEARLPPGAEVRYRQQTVWEAYRWHITATIALVLLQAALITGLLLQRVRKQRAEAERTRTEAELLHTRAELAHMMRVSTLGELSGSLAHELNQPLAAILSNAQAAQRFMASGNETDLQEVREILGDIVLSDKHAGDVIRRMQSMVRKDTVDAAPLDMAAAVNEVLLLLHSDAVLRRVNVSLQVEPGLPMVMGNRIQLQQVVLNLLLNAFDAMKDSDVNARIVVLAIAREDEQMLKVTVTDIGHGLAEDTRARVFEAFYSTKPNGLGMGLSISRSIVEAHRGRLWAENNSGRGATFCFTVPLATR
jgi:signal transduction histidine kinase